MSKLRWLPRNVPLLIVAIGCALAMRVATGSFAQDAPSNSEPRDSAPREPAPGVTLNKPQAFPGYTLLFPLRSRMTYLIDMQGRVVNEWESAYTAGQEAYLLENGNLLRATNLGEDEGYFAGASQGGRIQEFTWDGELVWDFKFHDERQIRHHAITRMPNGNVMMIVWERKTPQECIAAGVNPDYAGNDEILVDCLIEVKPTGKTTGEVVWEWHIWDHLIQDHDKTKANFGDVAAHPELIDANYARANGGFFGNFFRGFVGPPERGRDRRGARNRDDSGDRNAQDEAVRRLQGIGYVGTADRRGGPRRPIPDWTHVNAVSYNAKLDQIMISPREFNEVWIIDHSTTTAEAAAHTGGRYGKGGDLLYRWGNPQTYRAGTQEDQRFFSQHDTHWIPDGLPGAGNMLVFNNGGRPDGNYSSVDELVLPVDADGNYIRATGAPFGPTEPTWSYTAKEPADFFAPLMSGAQRLPNGNTLICTGFGGEIFEVTPDKEVVWRFVVPEDASGGPGGFGPPGGIGQRDGAVPPAGFGPPGGFGPPLGSVSILPGPLRGFLQLSDEQLKELDEFEKTASATLDGLLTEEQGKQFEAMRADPFRWIRPDEIKVGRILPAAMQEELKLADEQRKTLNELQASVDDTIAKLFTDDQKEQLKRMEEMFRAFAGGGGPNFGPPGGGPNFGPPGRDRFARGGRAGDGGRRDQPGGLGRGFMGGLPGSAPVFRAYRYGVDDPALADKDLTPGKTLVEIAEEKKTATNSANEANRERQRDDEND
jgi:hypothetical protein